MVEFPPEPKGSLSVMAHCAAVGERSKDAMHISEKLRIPYETRMRLCRAFFFVLSVEQTNLEFMPQAIFYDFSFFCPDEQMSL